METLDKWFRRVAFGFVVAAGVIVCGATCLAFLARVHWGFDLFTHFRVQYFVSLLVVVLLLFWRHKRWTAVFAVLAAVNLSYIAPFYFGQPERGETFSERPIRALLLNVNSKYGDIGRTIALIREFNPDLIVMAEVTSRWTGPIEAIKDAYPTSVVLPREDSFGIAVLSKLKMSETEVLSMKPAEVPTVTATVHAGDNDFTLIATHPLPPSGAGYSKARNEQLRGLARLSTTAHSPVFLLGDLNVTPWSPHFQDLLHHGELKDSMRSHGIQASWPTWVPIFFIPIDHCLHSDGIRVLDRRLGPYVKSDHLPVIVDFSIP